MLGYIYKITNLINGKIYIGKTEESIDRRFYEHKLNVKLGAKQNKLYSAMKKYGVDNFIVEEIDHAENREELCDKEKYWIKTLKSQDNNIGYNIASGGDGGHTWSAKGYKTMNKNGKNTFVKEDEVEKYLKDGYTLGGHSVKINSNTRRFGRWVNNGVEQKKVFEEELETYLENGWVLGYTDKAKNNLSKSHIGKSNIITKPKSEETIKKLSGAIKGRRWVNNGVIQKQVKLDELNNYLLNGFVLGRLKIKGGDVNEKVN